MEPAAADSLPVETEPAGSPPAELDSEVEDSPPVETAPLPFLHALRCIAADPGCVLCAAR